MIRFLTLLKREWLEWRTVLIVVLALFGLGLVLIGYGSYQISNKIEHGTLYFNQSSSGEVHFGNQDSTEAGAKVQRGDMGHPDKELAISSHILRGSIATLNFILLLLAIFYFADATFKERSDGSTFYFRSLPTTDWMLLASKLVFGAVGILLLSYVLGMILVFYLKAVTPGIIKTILAAGGYSLGQLSMSNLLAGWASFHILELFWLLPFALYFLLISTIVKNRPLLISTGLLFLFALLWKYFFGIHGIPNQLTMNISLLPDILSDQWVQIQHLSSGDTVDMFGSFSQYIFSLRTLISLIVAGGLFWTTRYFYQKNIEVS